MKTVVVSLSRSWGESEKSNVWNNSASLFAGNRPVLGSNRRLDVYKYSVSLEARNTLRFGALCSNTKWPSSSTSLVGEDDCSAVACVAGDGIGSIRSAGG